MKIEVILSESEINKISKALENATNQGASDLSVCLTCDLDSKSKKIKIESLSLFGICTTEYYERI